MLLARASVPAVSVAPPTKVLLPLSVRVPAPVFAKPPSPLTTPLSVKLPAPPSRLPVAASETALAEGSVYGFGGFVLQALAEHGALDRGLKVRTLVLPDIFQDQDKPEVMYAQAGLDAEGIARSALKALGIDSAGLGAVRA